MRKSRFSEKQIIRVLGEVELGQRVKDIYWALGYRQVATAEYVFEDQVYRNQILAGP